MQSRTIIDAWARVGTIACAMFLLSGCATFYVDGSLQNANVAAERQPTTPLPVQLIFNFQTKSTNNSRATEYLRKHVEQTITDSHLFGEISAAPTASGALLSITLNNIPVTSESDAAAKGFATGLTLGLAGNTVSDGYSCTVEYISATGSAKIEATAQHMIHTTVGAKGAPKNSIKAKNADEAAITMTRQIITSALDKLSRSDNFK